MNGQQYGLRIRALGSAETNTERVALSVIAPPGSHPSSVTQDLRSIVAAAGSVVVLNVPNFCERYGNKLPINVGMWTCTRG